MSSSAFFLSNTLQGIIEEVDMRKIKISSFYYRGVQEEDLSALANSIREKGLLQPITVRVSYGFFEVVIGNRRYAACKLLGLRKITCNIVELDEQQAFQTSLIENMQRKELSPIEEARAYKEYVSRYGRGSISELARRLGRSVAYIDKRTRLLDLPDDIIKMISVTDITISSAEELLPVRNKQEQCEIARIARDKGLSSKEIRELAAQFRIEDPIYHHKDRWEFETRIADLDRDAQKSYDKAIIAVRAAMNKMISIMDNIEDNWIIYEMLRQHKETLHSLIDLLIKEKRKI